MAFHFVKPDFVRALCMETDLFLETLLLIRTCFLLGHQPLWHSINDVTYTETIGLMFYVNYSYFVKTHIIIWSSWFVSWFRTLSSELVSLICCKWHKTQYVSFQKLKPISIIYIQTFLNYTSKHCINSDFIYKFKLNSLKLNWPIFFF